MLNQISILKVLSLLEKEYSNTTTALIFETPFQLLVSTMLAAQSTDVQVNKITGKLYKKYICAKDFSKLTNLQVEEEIKSVGLYRNKAKNIVAMSEILIKKHKGMVPQNRDALEALPGVGRKTANVVLSVGFNIPAFAVDTHVFRVSNRIGLAKAANVLKTEEQLMTNIAKNKWGEAHHWLIWHGRKICKARNPLCEECVIEEFCKKYKVESVKSKIKQKKIKDFKNKK